MNMLGAPKYTVNIHLVVMYSLLRNEPFVPRLITGSMLIWYNFYLVLMLAVVLDLKVILPNASRERI
jgi:hypothetical protein